MGRTMWSETYLSPALPASSRASPYARLNLRRNPFGEWTREERADVAVVDVQPWLEALRHPRAVVQFIGPCGHGKTTHLLALQRQLPGASYVYLPEDAPRPPVPGQRPLLIDEAQRLGYWQRRRVFRRGGSLALGTHDDLTRPLRRFQLNVITVDVAADRSPERLLRILNRRIDASRLTNAGVPYLGLEQVLALQRHFGSDIRRIEYHLYEQFQHAVRAARKEWSCRVS